MSTSYFKAFTATKLNKIFFGLLRQEVEWRDSQRLEDQLRNWNACITGTETRGLVEGSTVPGVLGPSFALIKLFVLGDQAWLSIKLPSLSPTVHK
jgi:hypothetical protein